MKLAVVVLRYIIVCQSRLGLLRSLIRPYMTGEGRVTSQVFARQWGKRNIVTGMFLYDGGGVGIWYVLDDRGGEVLTEDGGGGSQR